MQSLIEQWFVQMHLLLNSWLMLAAWSIPFSMGICMGLRKKMKLFYLVALFCLPFVFYYLWAVSGIWSSHEVALTFNRTAQLASVFVLVLFIRGLYERR